MLSVSVVVPAYNRAHFLNTVVDTVLSQTFTDLELIIVDDGSQDDTRLICMQLAERDTRVRYIYQNNKGLPGARNMGIRAARGEFIALLDSDDLWEPTKLEKQWAVVEHNPDIDVIYCDYAKIDEAGQVYHVVHPPDTRLPTMYESLLYYNIVHGSASAVLIRKACFDRVGLFDEALHSLEDWDMWIRLAQFYRFAFVPEVLVYLRQHTGQMQRNVASMADAYLQLMDKVSLSILPKHKDHLARVRWHNQLFAAEQYCIVAAYTKCWYALALAVRSWPQGLLSPRTWYVAALSLTGPLYPRSSAVGTAFRGWCRRHFHLDSVTGWRHSVR